MAKQPGILLYLDNYETVRNVLNQEQKGNLLDALMDGTYQGDDQLVRMAFNIFNAAIQRTNEKYQEIREKNRENAMKRWESMKKKAEAYDRMQLDAVVYEAMQDNANQPQPQSQSQSESHGKNMFHPPRVEEVAAYCRERGNDIDPEKFVSYYQRQGWELSNGRKMKDWRAAVVNWEKNAKRRCEDGAHGDQENDRVDGQRKWYVL